MNEVVLKIYVFSSIIINIMNKCNFLNNQIALLSKANLKNAMHFIHVFQILHSLGQYK